MEQVSGKLPQKNKTISQKLKQELQNLGYEVAESPAEISFSKKGQLEMVLHEIIPLVEEKGWNVRSELILEEEDPEKAANTRYEKGRILREFQRG